MQTLPTPTENVFYRLNNNLTFLVRKNFDFPRLGYGSLFLLLSLWLFVFVICFVLFGFYPRMNVLPVDPPRNETDKQTSTRKQNVPRHLK